MKIGAARCVQSFSNSLQPNSRCFSRFPLSLSHHTTSPSPVRVPETMGVILRLKERVRECSCFGAAPHVPLTSNAR